jgi:UDP-glucuronate 4-epimerase
MKIVVTGAAGFIGFHVCQRLIALGHEVIGLDEINDYYDTGIKLQRLRLLGLDFLDMPEWLKTYKSGQFEFTRLQIQDLESTNKVFERIKPQIVIHLAAQAGLVLENQPASYYTSNAKASAILLQTCSKTKSIQQVLMASSSSVYGLESGALSEELDCMQPISHYALTKRAMELYAMHHAKLNMLPITIMRFFTVYGPLGRPDMVVWKFIDNIRIGKPISLRNNGEMWRNYTYVNDLIDGIYRLIALPPTADDHFSRVINLANDTEVKLSALLNQIEKDLNLKAIIEHEMAAANELTRNPASVIKIEQLLGWKAQTSIESGLEACIKSLQKS